MNRLLLQDMYVRRRQNELLDAAKKASVASMARRGRGGTRILPPQLLQRAYALVRSLVRRRGKAAERIAPGVSEAR